MIQKNDKINPLMYAAKKGDLQLIHTILNHKPYINNKDSFSRNALFYSISAERGDNADIVLSLIKSNININDTEISNYQKGFEGHSPLTLAAKLNLKNTVKALLDNSANLDYQNPFNNNTALHYAVLNSNFELVKLFISHKARIDLKNKHNKNPIELATENNNIEIYELLSNEMNKLNEEKEKIIQDIVKNEDIISQQNNLNSNLGLGLGLGLGIGLGKNGFGESSSSSKKINKKNKKDNNNNSNSNSNNKDINSIINKDKEKDNNDNNINKENKEKDRDKGNLSIRFR
jgi:ankyrin repeat protein